MVTRALWREQKHVALHKQITKTVNVWQCRRKSPESLDSCTVIINEKERKFFKVKICPDLSLSIKEAGGMSISF